MGNLRQATGDTRRPTGWAGLTQWGCRPGGSDSSRREGPDFQDTMVGPSLSCVPWTSPFE